ncbi:MAG TPA: glycosyltransferase family 4 protein [Vicinamibacterales bacterium]
MRILFASDWWPPRVGGVESQGFDLASMLASRGHDVRVLTTWPNPSPLPHGQRSRVEHLDVPMTAHIAVPDPRRIRAIAERIEAHRPDVVHAHGMFSPLALGTILAAARVGVPSVLTVHSLLRPVPVFAAAAMLFRAAANRAAVVTGVSAATVRDITRASGRAALQIPNGLAIGDWDCSRSDADDLRVVAVTRLVTKKRPIDLVHAFASIDRALPRLDIRLDIAGDGPERSTLEREAERLGLRDTITFHGNCSRAEVRALLGRASFFAHAGSHEAFGLAVLEARAAGLPVVAMASGGLPEIVDHGRHGLLARTLAEFHAFAARMAADTELRRRCAAEAARNLEPYGWARVVPQHEAAYARAMDRRVGGRGAAADRVAAAS